MTEVEWQAGWPSRLDVGDVLLQPAFRSRRRPLRLFAADVLGRWGTLLTRQFADDVLAGWGKPPARPGCDGPAAARLALMLADGRADAAALATARAAARAIGAATYSRLTSALATILKTALADEPTAEELAHVALWSVIAACESGPGCHDYDGANAEGLRQREVVRDIFGNPFRPAAFSPKWRTSNVVTLARHTDVCRDFSALPLLADALMDGGCDNEDVLSHCRGPGPHVHGCWVVDLILCKS